MTESPLWHPFTQHALQPESIHISHAQGSYLYDKDGRQIIDAISSWWVNIHGHNHPKITAAIQAQAEKLDQVIFAGFTHAPAEQLAEKLIALTPNHLTRVFLSDSGSTAVEVALKMALGYWAHKNQPRTIIVALENAYHGDTFGAMSVGGRSVFNAPYEPFLFNVHHLPFPAKNHEHRTIENFEKLLREQGDNIVALIVEPLVLGAAGMLMYTPQLLAQLHALCQKYGVIFIADEVMTGWGRTGTRFACDQAQITPDILCTSKGLTSGSLPLAATLASEEIYQAFFSTDRAKTFFHSSSYTGNPLACAAACAAFDIWDTEPVTQRIKTLSDNLAAQIPRLSSRPDIENVRQTGCILAMDVRNAHHGYLSDIAPKLYRFFLSQGVLLRPLGNTIYILPPYCTTNEDIHVIINTIIGGCDALGNGALERAA